MERRLAAVGLTGRRFHDLRHTGNTLAARSGVSTRDLMTRKGHDSVRAALIYQHATAEADERIASSLDADIARAIGGGRIDGDDAAVSPCRSGDDGSGVARLCPGWPRSGDVPVRGSWLTWQIGRSG